MKFLYITLALIFIALVAASKGNKSVINFSVGDFCKLAFKDEGSATVGKIVNVSFNGTCTEDGKALLKKGTYVTVNFEFQAFQAEAVLTSKVEGKVGPWPWVSFPLPNPDACKDSGLACPIPANKTLNYLPILHVLSSFPALSVIVKWELQNKDTKDVFSVVIPATIVD